MGGRGRAVAVVVVVVDDDDAGAAVVVVTFIFEERREQGSGLAVVIVVLPDKPDVAPPGPTSEIVSCTGPRCAGVESEFVSAVVVRPYRLTSG